MSHHMNHETPLACSKCERPLGGTGMTPDRVYCTWTQCDMYHETMTEQEARERLEVSHPVTAEPDSFQIWGQIERWDPQADAHSDEGEPEPLGTFPTLEAAQEALAALAALEREPLPDAIARAGGRHCTACGFTHLPPFNCGDCRKVTGLERALAKAHEVQDGLAATLTATKAEAQTLANEVSRHQEQARIDRGRLGLRTHALLVLVHSHREELAASDRKGLLQAIDALGDELAPELRGCPACGSLTEQACLPRPID